MMTVRSRTGLALPDLIRLAYFSSIVLPTSHEVGVQSGLKSLYNDVERDRRTSLPERRGPAISDNHNVSKPKLGSLADHLQRHGRASISQTVPFHWGSYCKGIKMTLWILEHTCENVKVNAVTVFDVGRPALPVHDCVEVWR